MQHYRYDPTAQLGQGYSSQVFLGEDTHSGQRVAIKVVGLEATRQRKQEHLLFREVRVLRECSHPNVVHC